MRAPACWMPLWRRSVDHAGGRLTTPAEAGYDPALANADLLPVPQDRRTWNLWNIAALWVGMAITIPTYTLASSLVERGWTWQAAVGSVVLGNIIVLIPIALISHAGTRYGIPFPVLARSSFGVFGANIPAILRAIVACGWFGIQTWIGGFAIFKLIEVMWPGIATLPVLVPASGIATLPVLVPAWFGIGTGEFLCFMFFWAINLWIALRGMESIKFLETWGGPFLMLIAAMLFIWAWVNVGGLGPMLENPPRESGGVGVTAVFGAGLTSAVAFWGTMALSIPDFSRYAKSQRDQVLGQALGLPITMGVFAFIGATVTAATVVIFGARISDPVELLAQVGGPVTVVVAMLGLTIATLTTNIAANVVAPANGFSLAPVQRRRGIHLHLAHRVRRVTGAGGRHPDRRLFLPATRAFERRRPVSPDRLLSVPRRRQLGSGGGAGAPRLGCRDIQLGLVRGLWYCRRHLPDGNEDD